MSFGIALSGINAAQNELSVVSNNIANSETVGFKESTAVFADMFAVSPQGVGSTQTGNGVKVSEIAQQFSQGNIESTGNNLDLAISGDGFFVVNNAGTRQYSRAGQFSTDSQGYVVNPQGNRLQVYAPTANGAFNTSSLTDLQLNSGYSAPAATTNVAVDYNLPANATAPTSTPFDPTNSATYNNSTSVTVYDSLGTAHTASLYFVQSGTANTWNSYMYVDGKAASGGVQQMTYSSSGALLTPASGAVNYGTYAPGNGANTMNLNFDFSKATQYGQTFSVSAVSQDGFTTGSLSSFSVDSSGIVSALYSNGKTIALGQVAMAAFPATEKLQAVGNTSWTETYGSGQPLLGTAGASGYGLVQSGSVEKSNVDVTAQLVNMITAQRYFQANAQMISTENQITQTIINLR